uniref:Membrane spanning 4-domains A2 n=1 Tax=Rousettus aegyptiacus TaxID=9407 RepID=A0A7J8H2S3_ROUAE|nr:membrane spanning 4-domains A2 [Rousettus aegyptiacus]
METVSRSRADIALPNPQELPSEPGIELSEVPSHEDTQPGRTVRSPPRQTWLTFLKKELEFLGVTQILFAISGFLSVMSEKNHAAYLEASVDDFCSAVFFSTSLEERLYEELNIYSPIYSELEALPPTDT